MFQRNARRLRSMLPLAAGAAGGALVAATLLTLGYRWVEPRIADRVGGGR